MIEPQAGIVPAPSPHPRFLILRVDKSPGARKTAARVAASAPAVAAGLARQDPRAQLRCVVGLGARFWDALRPGRRPAGLRPFRAVSAGNRRAPSTGGDLLVHVLSRRRDLSFELALQLRGALGDAARILEDVDGFEYLDSRDLTGFIDGTENPKGARRRARVALIGREDPPFAGGSYVFTQRYVHDLAKWKRLSTRSQERAVGRTKSDSRELRAVPPTAHISRVVIEEDGKELEIVRHSFPYGDTREHGLFFIAYNRNLDTLEKMLARMIGTAADRRHDALLDYTRAVSGATFFAPSLRILRGLGR